MSQKLSQVQCSILLCDAGNAFSLPLDRFSCRSSPSTFWNGEVLRFHCLLEGPEPPASASQMPEPPSAPTRALGCFLKIILPVSLETSLTQKKGREGGRRRQIGWVPSPEYLLCVGSDSCHTAFTRGSPHPFSDEELRFGDQ